MVDVVNIGRYPDDPSADDANVAFAKINDAFNNLEINGQVEDPYASAFGQDTLYIDATNGIYSSIGDVPIKRVLVDLSNTSISDLPALPGNTHAYIETKLSRNTTDNVSKIQVAYGYETADLLVRTKIDTALWSPWKPPVVVPPPVEYPIFSTNVSGLVPKPETSTGFLKHDGSWEEVVIPEVEALTSVEVEGGTSTVSKLVSPANLKLAVETFVVIPTVTDISGNAGTADKLKEAVTINGVSFDGSADIELTAANIPTLNQDTTGNAGSADKLKTPVKINGVDFDGTQDVTVSQDVPVFVGTEAGLVPDRTGSTTDRYLREDGTWTVPPDTDTDTTYALLTKSDAETGTAETANVISAKVLKEAILFHAPTGSGEVTDITGNAGSATKLETPRSINGVYFDGTEDIIIPTGGGEGGEPYILPKATTTVLGGIKVGTGLSVLEDGTLSANPVSITDITGNAATATKLKDAIEINGIVFDGSQSIDIPIPEPETYTLPTATADVLGGIKVGTGLVITDSKLSVDTLNQDTTGNAATATVAQSAGKLTTPIQINGIEFDGSTSIDIDIPEPEAYVLPTATDTVLGGIKIGNGLTITEGTVSVDEVIIPEFNSTESGLVPASGTGNTKYLRQDGTWEVPTDTNTTYDIITSAEVDTGTATSGKLVTAALLKQAVTTHTPTITNITGNAGTATKLANARNINGVSFDGTANIDLPVFTTDKTGLVPARTGSTTTKYLREDGTWVIPTNTTYSAMSAAELTTGTSTTTRSITAKVLRDEFNKYGISNATEAVAGKAKIATTAVAQAGVNDTDIITPLKLANTRHSTWSNKSGMLFNTTYINSSKYEREVAFLSTIGSSVLMTAKVTFTNLTTKIATIVYFGSVSNWSGGIYCGQNFIVPPNTSYKVEIVRSDVLDISIGVTVQFWSERDYV